MVNVRSMRSTKFQAHFSLRNQSEINKHCNVDEAITCYNDKRFSYFMVGAEFCNQILQETTHRVGLIATLIEHSSCRNWT